MQRPCCAGAGFGIWMKSVVVLGCGDRDKTSSEDIGAISGGALLGTELEEDRLR